MLSTIDCTLRDPLLNEPSPWPGAGGRRQWPKRRSWSTMAIMRHSPPWLHLILSVALVLSGITGAQAATSALMQHEAAGHEPAPVPVPPQDVARQPPPCHGAATLGSPEAGTPLASAHGGALDSGHASDCCKSGTCGCECVHHAQVVIAPAFFTSPAIARAASVRVMKPAHAEQLLPHLIRPPIG
jgi:hypothetical protein